jgi:hypothetical protein
MIEASVAASATAPERYLARRFWKCEIPFLAIGIVLAPAAWTSDEARLLRDGASVEVRVIERHAAGEYLVVYKDTVFIASSSDEDVKPGDRFTTLIDPVNPMVNSTEDDATGLLLVATGFALAPLVYPVGRWLNRRSSRQNAARLASTPQAF